MGYGVHCYGEPPALECVTRSLAHIPPQPPGGAFPTPGGAYQQHQPYGQAGAGYQQGQQGPTAAGMGMGMAPGSMMMNPALMGLFNPIMMAAMMPQVAAMMGMDANGSAAAPVPMQGAMGAMPPQAAAGAMPTGMHQGQMMMPAGVCCETASTTLCAWLVKTFNCRMVQQRGRRGPRVQTSSYTICPTNGQTPIYTLHSRHLAMSSAPR